MNGAHEVRIHRYGDGDFILAHGPKNGPQVLVIQPFFEEMNRCRTLLAELCRRLARSGVGCWLPDLPGTGESPRALESVGWDDWRTGIADGAALVDRETGHSPCIVSVRGGALLDDAIDAPRWRLAPTSGRSLLSDLRRSALASGSDPAFPAGYHLPPALAEPLAAAEPMPNGRVRTLRLSTDRHPADLYIDGAPSWRQPEPKPNHMLAAIIADDIASWLAA